MTKYRFSLVACARWESDYITEWLNYHRAIGVDHVFLYCNDDDPAELYGVVMSYVTGPDPFVTFLHFPFQGQQRFMYQHFLRSYRDQTEWFSLLDIDEFIQIMDGRSISEFISHYEADWDAIALHWLIFGPNGFKQRPRGSILLQYFRRTDLPHVFTKIITRSSAIDVQRVVDGPTGAFFHFWYDLPELRVCNVVGESMAGYYDDFPEKAFHALRADELGARLISIARVCHYFMHSEADFQRRFERGTIGDYAGQTMWKEISEREDFQAYLEHLHVVEDHSMAAFWSAYLAHSHTHSVISRPPYENLARDQSARQSSLSQWSTCANEAMAATNGQITGKYKFHTAQEEGAWWEVSLSQRSIIMQVTIYNCLEPERKLMAPFQIETWLPDSGYRPVYRVNRPIKIGGLDGFPHVWIAQRPVQAERVRIRLLTKHYLHLDQVEIYGYPALQAERTST